MGKLGDLEFTSKTISFSNYFANIRLILVIQSYPRALGNRSRGLGGQFCVIGLSHAEFNEKDSRVL